MLVKKARLAIPGVLLVLALMLLPACGSKPRVVGQVPITTTNAAQVASYSVLKAGSYVLSAVLSPDGTLIASGASDGSVRVWDLKTGAQIKELKGHTGAVNGVAFSPDGKQLASASSDKSVRVWELESGKETANLQGHTATVYGVAFSPDGKQLASASDDKSVSLWDVQSGKATTTLKGDGSFRSVAYSPDGNQVAASDNGKAVHLWDVKAGTESAKLDSSTDYYSSYVVYNADGSALAAVGNDGIQIWETKTNTELLRSKSAPTLVINAVAYSPDGTLIASGNGDGTVRLWDAKTGAELAVLRGHTGSVQAVQFSSDSKLLVSAGKDSTIQLWGVSDPPPEPGQSGATLKGKVEGLGKPVAKQRITLNIKPAGGDSTQPATSEALPGGQAAARPELYTKTDADGVYTFTNLIAGDASLSGVAVSAIGSYSTCKFPGFSGMSITGTNASGQRVIIMILNSSGKITLKAGEVTTQDVIVTCS